MIDRWNSSPSTSELVSTRRTIDVLGFVGIDSKYKFVAGVEAREIER